MEVGEGGVNGDERDFAWGDGCTMQCADDTLLSCTLESCMVCEPMSPNKFNFFKKQKIKIKNKIKLHIFQSKMDSLCSG